MNKASTLVVNCHTSLCVHSHPKGKEKKRRRRGDGDYKHEDGWGQGQKCVPVQLYTAPPFWTGTQCNSLSAVLTLQLEITEFIPTLLYFGYTALMIFTFWLLTGTIGFYAAYSFIRKIYAAIKID